MDLSPSMSAESWDAGPSQGTRGQRHYVVSPLVSLPPLDAATPPSMSRSPSRGRRSCKITANNVTILPLHDCVCPLIYRS
jgi:hypothetical protein